MQIASCPFCEASVKVSGAPKMGQRVVCHSCKTELEVVWLNPLELDWPMDEYDGEEELEYEYEFDDFEDEDFDE